MKSLNMQQFETLLLIAIGLVVVTLISLVVYVVYGNRRQREKLKWKFEKSDPSPRPILQMKGQILSLSLDEESGRLQVEIGGVTYPTFESIKDPDLKRRVVTAAMELIRFTGVLGSDAVAPASVERTHSWREDLRQESESELARIRTPLADARVPEQSPAVSREDEDRFLGMLGETSQPASMEKPTLASSIQHALQPKPLDAERTPSFVHDIEEIVQRRIRLIPALAGRGLHVQLAPGGGVRFLFEGQEYQTVDDIPNMTARQLIKDSIQEWEEIT